METNNQLPNLKLNLENIESIEKIYEFEEKLMLSVQQGNVEEINKLMGNNLNFSTLTSHMEKRMPNDLLRFHKNNLIITNTLLRTAAKRGGLPVIYLHTISEKYALSIESAPTPEYLVKVLLPTMCREYAIAVDRFSSKAYSPLIKEVIRYITSNVTKDLCLTTLAGYFHVNPSFLSRKFKEETKMSFTHYTNHYRIELAKYFFEKDMHNITEVAYMVGYNDSSYFTKIFKKFTGLLPKDYIKTIVREKE
ncbi:MAG: helix-turn-helix domain-containing protein [Clostridiales bacterium]|nr:helix-turn-helix domain-containing protein [Clostridiales bacterium]